MFVDQVRIFVKAGRGGDGVSSFRREKFVPRGGPDGGDGGHGGNVAIVASRHLNTLLGLRYQKQYKAKPGGHGGDSNKHGRTARDVEIRVPIGTLVTAEDTGEILADLTEDGLKQVVAHGGRGGRGNSHFATPTNRTPTHFEHGTDGEERWVQLDLKLLADVGLVGLPNAGKSTLIAAISSARPKIADYPFTTLIANLGVVAYGDEDSFVVADIPGLIEGAHEGKGLGFQFLRHVERTSYLLHLVDVSDWASEDPVTAFETMRKELIAYHADLGAKPFAVVGTKRDINADDTSWTRLTTYCQEHGCTAMFLVSAVTRQGLDPLVQFVGKQVQALRGTACASRS